MMLLAAGGVVAAVLAAWLQLLLGGGEMLPATAGRCWLAARQAAARCHLSVT